MVMQYYSDSYQYLTPLKIKALKTNIAKKCNKKESLSKYR